MKKIFCFGLAIAIVFSMAGCSGGVSQEEYDLISKELETVTAQRDELEQYQPSKSLSQAMEEFDSIFPNLILTEVVSGKTKILQMTSILSMSQVAEDISEKSSALGAKVATLSGEDWFDYNYVYINISVNGIGMATSMAIDCSTLSFQTATWENG